MYCPLETAAVLFDLIDHATRENRRAALAGDAEVSARQADHLHRLTHLLHDYSDELLQEYWDVERPAFARHLDAGPLADWEPLWERLRPFVEGRSDVTEAVYAHYELGTVD